jgi:hypothetical protein
MNFDLDSKAARFLITAIKCKIESLEADQKANPSDEDLIAEASNDMGYYRALIGKFEAAL